LAKTGHYNLGTTGDWRHPVNLGTDDVEAFLNDMVIRRRVSASAQNQALCSLVFLYKHVLDGVIANDHLGKFMLERARRVKRLPTVLSQDEVRRVIDAVPETSMSRLMLEQGRVRFIAPCSISAA